MTPLVLGIDEAGRGPAVGALVLAAVAVDRVAAHRLRRAGVVDSKRLGSGSAAHEKRVLLRALIERWASWVAVEVCDVALVDEYVARGELNVLERERAERLLRGAPRCARILADGRALFSPLRALFPDLQAVDRGEAKHVAVAAASICAKARRDELFACVAGRYRGEMGEIQGGGYANAPTRAWTARYLRRHGSLPPEARVSWPWGSKKRSLHRT